MKSRSIPHFSARTCLSSTIASAALLVVHTAQAADGTWTQVLEGNASGTWSDAETGNWLPSAVASGSGFTADFSTLDTTGLSTVTLGEPRTIGNLIFDDTDTATNSRWILDNGGTAANKLTLAGTTPTITVNNLGNGSLTNSTVTISAAISGSNGLTKDGTGTVASASTHGKGVLVLSGANDYTGGTTVNTGALAAANSSAFGTGAVTVSSGAQLQIRGVNIANTININGSNALFSNASSGSNLSGTVNLQSNSSIKLATNSGNSTMTLSGTLNLAGNTLTVETINVNPAVTLSALINGSGGITKNNDGTLRITADNINAGTYSGTTTLKRGVLELGSDGALGSGTFAFSTDNDQTATVRSNSSTARTIAATVTFPSTGSVGNANSRYIFGSSSSGDLTFTNTTTINLGSVVRRFEPNNATRFDAGFTGTGGIIKQGAGTLVLNGTSDYTGPTTVNNGTMVVNGSLASTSVVTVNSGGSLEGNSGTMGAATILPGGTLAPGNSIGTLDFSELTLGGIANFEIDPTLGLGLNADLVNVTSAVTYGGILNVIYGGSNTNFTNGMLFNLFDAGSYIGSFDTVNLPGLGEGLSWKNDLATNGSISVIPEPDVAMLIGSFGMLCLLRRKTTRGSQSR